MDHGNRQWALSRPTGSGVDDVTVSDPAEIKKLICRPAGTQGGIAKDQATQDALGLFWVSHRNFPTPLGVG
jgi:hypothetical protein